MSELAGGGGGGPLLAGFGGLDNEQQVFDQEEDIQQQQPFLGPVRHTIFTAMLATFLGLCALLRSRSISKGGHSGATQTIIDHGGSISSSMYALLHSYRYSVASAASQPLLLLVVALAFIVPAAEAGCREIDGCGLCNSNCPGGEYRDCHSGNSGCTFGTKRE